MSDIGIIECAIFYDFNSDVYYVNNELSIGNNLMLNTINYLKIKSILTDNSTADTFANYTDNARRKIITISGTKGTMLIGFPTITPLFDNGLNLKKIFERLVNSVNAKGYIAIFKNEVFDYLKPIQEEARFETLVNNLTLILDNTDRDFEVYMSNFSFDALKDKLTEERVKYFDATKDILAKAYVQITSIPIAISAAVFATYKVDDKFTLLLIFLAYGVYTFYVFKILLFLKGEIEIVENDFIVESTGIIQQSKLHNDIIQKETRNIKERIHSVKGIIKTFMRMFLLLSILFMLFVAYQYFSSTIKFAIGNIVLLRFSFYLVSQFIW